MATEEEKEAFEFDSARFIRVLNKLPEPPPEPVSATGVIGDPTLIATNQWLRDRLALAQAGQTSDEQLRADIANAQRQANMITASWVGAGLGQAGVSQSPAYQNALLCTAWCPTSNPAFLVRLGYPGC